MSVGETADVGWVVFAVPEEAVFFRRVLGLGRREDRGGGIRVCVTGMGKGQARRAVEGWLREERPKWIVTSGFAGGLNPEWPLGTVAVGQGRGEGAARLEASFLGAGGVRARFFCADRVASTPEQKRLLREQGGWDAVEMESGVIHDVAAVAGIGCVTVRVISDAADEALPLDFNAFMDAECRMRWGALAGAMARRPKLVVELMRFNGRLRGAAKGLGEVLARGLRSVGS